MLDFQDPRRIRAYVAQQFGMIFGTEVSQYMLEYSVCELLTHCLRKQIHDTVDVQRAFERKILPKYSEFIHRQRRASRVLFTYLLFMTQVRDRLSIELVRALSYNICVEQVTYFLEGVKTSLEAIDPTITDQDVIERLHSVFVTVWNEIDRRS